MSDNRRTPAKDISKNFTVVQAIRGIASLWVVLYHASEGGHLQSLKAVLPNIVSTFTFTLGHYGVAMFFALSGFIIAHSLRDGVPSLAFFGRFLLRRSVRLDPPYWLSMAFVVVVGWISAQVQQELVSLPSLPQVLAHMAYLQEILRYPEINSVYWTLTYEIQFYSFLALMLLAGHWLSKQHHKIQPIHIRYAMFLIAILSALHLLDFGIHGLFVDLWKDFFIGCLAYYAIEDKRLRIPLYILAVILMVYDPLDHDHLFSRISTATALGLYWAARTRRIENGLNFRWLQFLGAISYSLYLVHNPITGASSFIIHKMLGHGLWADVAGLAFSLAVSIAVAAMFWWAIEKTSHRLSRKIKLYA